MLLDMEAPQILAYQPATAVAEKFETMVRKGLLNSRLKDYYDICMLSRSIPFDDADLRDSIAASFDERGTRVPAFRPSVLADEYAQRPEAMAQWAAFVTRLGASGVKAPDGLADVVDAISAFIMLPVAAVAGGESFGMKWVPLEGWS